MRITRENWGIIGDSRIDLYTLSNDNNMSIQVTNYGCTITSIKVPDSNGNIGDVALGFNTLDEYIKDNPFFGCIAGRFANRIAGGRFSLNGKEYTLARNDGNNHLHGGIKGFDKVAWKIESFEEKDAVGLVLKYKSPDGEEGYPGNLAVKLIYTLTNLNEIKMKYSAGTDKPTVLNLTNHSYFNLAGESSGDVLNHLMTINSENITEIDKTLIPTGRFLPIEGTPLDFKTPTPIGARIGADYDQLKFGGGYDHNYISSGRAGALHLIAKVSEPGSGRVMDVLTTQPAVQLYTGNFLDGHLPSKRGGTYKKRNGFCLETQHYPDSPNKPGFPSTVLNPGEEYTETTIYKFSVGGSAASRTK